MACVRRGRQRTGLQRFAAPVGTHRLRGGQPLPFVSQNEGCGSAERQRGDGARLRRDFHAQHAPAALPHHVVPHLRQRGEVAEGDVRVGAVRPERVEAALAHQQHLRHAEGRGAPRQRADCARRVSGRARRRAKRAPACALLCFLDTLWHIKKHAGGDGGAPAPPPASPMPPRRGKQPSDAGGAPRATAGLNKHAAAQLRAAREQRWRRLAAGAARLRERAPGTDGTSCHVFSCHLRRLPTLPTLAVAAHALATALPRARANAVQDGAAPDAARRLFGAACKPASRRRFQVARALRRPCDGRHHLQRCAAGASGPHLGARSRRAAARLLDPWPRFRHAAAALTGARCAVACARVRRA